MTIAEKIHQAKNVIYEFHLWDDEAIICNADEFTFKISYDKSELKIAWLNEEHPERYSHHSEIDDYTVLKDVEFLKDQFEKYIYLAEEL